jgi:hypothetical protein
MPRQHQPFADHPCATTHPTLIDQAQRFLALAIGASTRRTYTSGVKSYIEFVDSHGIQPAFPASLQTLCLWITALASAPRLLSLGTCKVYLAAVITRHAEMGLHSPLQDAPPVLDRIITGIKRWSADAQKASKPKLPITTAMLRSMKPYLNCSTRSDSLLWAMMWTATAGLLRISEFTQTHKETERTLKTAQLTLHDHHGHTSDLLSTSIQSNIQYVTLHLDASKTDPFRSGVDIIIASQGAIKALLQYSQHLQQQQPPPGPLSPLFHFPDMHAVKRSWLMRRVAKLLVEIGHQPESYSSHSFRKGGAVSLQQSGVEDSIVRRLGRWRSDAFHLYVRHAALDTLISANARL